MIPRIKSIDQQINMYAKLLKESSRYQAMIEMGKTTIDIQKYMPDINRAEAMMEWISEEAQEVSENLENLSSDMDEYEKKIDSATFGEVFTEEDFNQCVSSMQSVRNDGKEKRSTDQNVKVNETSDMKMDDRKQGEQEGELS